jgi:hypothetical protein
MSEETEQRLLDEAIAHRCMQDLEEKHVESIRQFIADCRLSASQSEQLSRLISKILIDAFGEGLNAYDEVLTDQMRRDGWA